MLILSPFYKGWFWLIHVLDHQQNFLREREKFLASIFANLMFLCTISKPDFFFSLFVPRSTTAVHIFFRMDGLPFIILLKFYLRYSILAKGRSSSFYFESFLEFLVNLQFSSRIFGLTSEKIELCKVNASSSFDPKAHFFINKCQKVIFTLEHLLRRQDLQKSVAWLYYSVGVCWGKGTQKKNHKQRDFFLALFISMNFLEDSELESFSPCKS